MTIKYRRSFFALAICVCAFLLYMAIKPADSSRLTIWVSQDPWSFDPYQFDFAAHHVSMGAIHLKLFSSYQDSLIKPTAASGWKVFDEFKVWNFSIRKDLKFSNGKKIVPKDVYFSIKRILLLAVRNKSRLPILEKIENARSIRAIDEPVSGLAFDDDSITIRLTSGEKELPTILSFGLFGIVPAESIDRQSLELIEANSISSGPFKVSSFDVGRKRLELSKREDFPKDLSSENSPDLIEITWARERRDAADILEGFEGELAPGGAPFFKGYTSTDIVYLQCFSYANKKSALFEAGARAALREKFYKNLTISGFPPQASMFPLGLSALKPAKHNVGNDQVLKGLTIRVRPPNNLQVPMLAALKEALLKSIHDLGGEVKLVENMSGSEYAKITARNNGLEDIVDIGSRGTSIGGEDPKETTRFMFSKEGIFLPDPTKKISEMISKPEFDLISVDERLQKDGVVWPVFHYSNGFWVSGRIDLSRYNTSLPLSEIQWMGLN